MNAGPTFHRVDADGVSLRVAVAGDGPLVVLIHGFPESWYSWRHQIGPLAGAGYRVAAPDLCGYGASDKPDAIEAYDMRAMSTDVLAIIEALGGGRDCAVVGHDWGAPIAWHTALTHPHRVQAVAGMSVPYGGRGTAPFTDIAKHVYGERFFYYLYFQEPGVAEAELEADVRRFLRLFYYAVSGEGMARPRPQAKPKEAKLLDGLLDPETLPDWLSEADLDYYTGEFERGGFRGPLNRYRNTRRDWEAFPELARRQVEAPACFIAGSREPVLAFVPGVDRIAMMAEWVPDLRTCHLFEGAGHWIQQEHPAEVTAALIAFLDETIDKGVRS